MTRSLEQLRFNTAVAFIYAQTNAIEGCLRGGSSASPALVAAVREAATSLVLLFAPMMPHLAEACWQALGQSALVAASPWPSADPELLAEDTLTLPVQINGKKRADITVGRDAGAEEIESAVLELEAVRRALAGKAPKKVIVVPQRIVNVVA